MSTRPVRWSVLLSGLTLLATVGCVDRRFVVRTNIPNAQVYIDDRPVGASPAYTQFDYYGFYTIKIVHPGYETIVKREHVAAPWYAYPPFDFITEVLWPFRIRDIREFNYTLYEAVQTRTDELLNTADALRQRGMMLPPAERPAEPRPPRIPPEPLPPPGVVPPVVPPVVPSVVPPVGPPVAPAPGPTPSVVPSGQPSSGYTPTKFR
ncbi:MAG: PEGA domain-containing protein [Planctomycetia bacterium]|nr:PEGA domain-containing protein [Planctomycetia bacterium]